MMDLGIWIAGLVLGFALGVGWDSFKRNNARRAVINRGWDQLIVPIMDWKIKPCHPTEVNDEVARLELPYLMEKAIAGAIMSRFRQEGKASVAEAVARMYMELEQRR